MNHEFRTKLLEALRSGKYKQCTKELRFKDSFCAAGVICDIGNPDGWINNRDDYPTHIDYDSMTYNYELLFGFSEVDILNLIELNDSGMTFPQIADYIEAHHIGEQDAIS